MLESMRERPVPTRAETADVANAILDGSDAVMLSGETSVGRYAVRAVKSMAGIIEETEAGDPSFRDPLLFSVPEVQALGDRAGFAVADAAVRAAADVEARHIVAFTRSGYTAGLVAKLRPGCPVIAFTPDPETVNRLNMHWGVLPFRMRSFDRTDDMVREVEMELLRSGQVRRGDRIVITASLPPGAGEKTNFMKVHRIGEKRT
jgi:pyruvate kinase